MALGHHYLAPDNIDFLSETYAAAKRAADYMLTQRDERGLELVHGDRKRGHRGIVGWRNIIDDYRISGASTELNSECYAALRRYIAVGVVSFERGRTSLPIRAEGIALREAINRYLLDPETRPRLSEHRRRRRSAFERHL